MGQGCDELTPEQRIGILSPESSCHDIGDRARALLAEGFESEAKLELIHGQQEDRKRAEETQSPPLSLNHSYQLADIDVASECVLEKSTTKEILCGERESFRGDTQQQTRMPPHCSPSSNVFTSHIEHACNNITTSVQQFVTASVSAPTTVANTNSGAAVQPINRVSATTYLSGATEGVVRHRRGSAPMDVMSSASVVEVMDGLLEGIVEGTLEEMVAEDRMQWTVEKLVVEESHHGIPGCASR
jgi:hypothetical protein